MFGGDPEYVPIWSGGSAVIGFVRICSGLFGVDNGKFCQSLSTFVNLCHGLVTVGQAGAVSLRREGLAWVIGRVGLAVAARCVRPPT